MPTYLIDTNAAIGLINKDEAVQKAIAGVEVATSVTVIGELTFGAEHSSRREANLASVAAFQASLVTYICDEETAAIYGQIKAELRKKGRMIPDNDIWIAATALQHGLTLFTRDAHFSEVDGLTVESW